MNRKTRIRTGTLLLYIFLLVAVQIPFVVEMPFHIDDPVFIRISEAIQQSPLNPLGSAMIWEGKYWHDMMSYSHPPLLAYYLHFLNMLSPGHFEIVSHAGFLIFFLLFGVSLFFFFSFFNLPPFVSSLIVLFSPAVFVSSHTIMMDVPTLAFGMLGLTVSLYGLRDEKIKYLIAGGVFFGLGGLVSYSAFIYPAVVVLYVLFVRKKRILLLWPVIVIPAVFFISWTAWVWAVTSRFVFGDFVKLLSLYNRRSDAVPMYKFAYNLAALGSTVLFTPVLYFWKIGEIRGKLYIIGAVLNCFVLAIALPGYGFYHQIVLGFILFAGVLMFLESIAILFCGKSGGLNSGNAKFLISWFVGFFILTFFMFPHGAVRYQLWFVVPVITLFLMSLKKIGHSDIFQRKILIISLIIGQVLVATVLSLADLELANGYKKSITNIIYRYKTPENSVWVASEWGIRYYAEKKGAKAILRYDNRPRTGDILVKPVKTASTYKTGYEHEPYGFLLDEVKLETTYPVRILNSFVKAGFYSDYWGLLPCWVAGRDVPLDELYIYMVKKRLPANEELQNKKDLGLLGGNLPASLKAK